MTPKDILHGRRPDRAAFVVAVVLAALGALLIWQGQAIPDKGGYAGIGSGDLPVFIGVGLVILAIAHVIKGLRHPADEVPPQRLLPVFLIVGGLAAQLILLKPLGFSVPSGLLFAASAAAFGKTRVVYTLPIGILFSLVVYGIFDRLLQLNLPAGLPETFIFGG